NALPLLFAADENAYSTSLNPWMPGLAIVARPAVVDTASAVPISTRNGGTRITRLAIFISYASIFLPRDSGVGPTMSPATNTAISTNASMPYSPEPTPPYTTSPSWIRIIGTMPPSGMNDSCIAFTEPFDAAVVALAHNADSAGPNRASLPSMLP